MKSKNSYDIIDLKEKFMNNISITVDRRTELLGIMLLPSDYNKNFAFLIEECGNKEYREKIFSNFSQFKNEKAIQLLNQIFEELNFRYDAPVSLFLQLNKDFTFDSLDEYPFETRLNKSQLVINFLNELPNFAETINFEEYYNSNQTFYEEIINETNEKINVENIVSFISSFYKMDISNIQFVINLLPYTTNGNFGSNHSNINYSNLGLKKFQKNPLTFVTDNNHGTLALHEFSHSIINPLTSKHSKIKGIAFSDIWDIMSQKAYGNVETIINEHIIRALEIFYLKNILKTKETQLLASEKLDREINNGFKHITCCLESLEKYYANIEQYEDFEEFFPEILKAIEISTEKRLTI